jgi:hypothetical protein
MVSKTDGGKMKFFVCQFIAICVEDMAIYVARKLGMKPHLVWKMVGFIWVFLWFSYILRGLVHGGVKEGVWTSSALRLSIFSRVFSNLKEI